MSTLKRYTAGTVPMIFAAVVIAAGFIVAACSDTQSPIAPGAGIGGDASVVAPSTSGNCQIAGATKDESSPFFLPGVNTVFIKAGNNCLGPITVSGDYGKVAGTDCFRVTFTAAGVTVESTGSAGCQGLGISHIEGVVGVTPTPTPTPTPPKEPTPTPTPTPTPCKDCPPK